MQKAMEVSMVFRKPVKSAAELQERIEQCERLQSFMNELKQCSASLQVMIASDGV